MPVIQHLLERWGFVKLARYGLVLTPEGRILSINPGILDDRAGGKIVGWREDDPDVTELPTWPAVRSGMRREDISPLAAPILTPADTQLPTAAGSQLPTPAGAQIPTSAPEAVMPVAVAPAPTVEEDDWEWTIALARARVAAEEAEVAAAAGPPPAAPPPRSLPEPIDPGPLHEGRRSVAKVPAGEPRPMAAAPNAEPIAAIRDEDSPWGDVRPDLAIPKPAATRSSGMSRADAPSTVIPVPALPSVQDLAKPGRLAPVVRTSSSPIPPATPRFANETRPAAPSITPHPAPGMSDDTEGNLSAGERTRPGVAMSPAARAVQLPSIKRRMARQG